MQTRQPFQLGHLLMRYYQAKQMHPPTRDTRLKPPQQLKQLLHDLDHIGRRGLTGAFTDRGEALTAARGYFRHHIGDQVRASKSFALTPSSREDWDNLAQLTIRKGDFLSYIQPRMTFNQLSPYSVGDAEWEVWSHQLRNETLDLALANNGLLPEHLGRLYALPSSPPKTRMPDPTLEDVKQVLRLQVPIAWGWQDRAV